MNLVGYVEDKVSFFEGRVERSFVVIRFYDFIVIVGWN